MNEQRLNQSLHGDTIVDSVCLEYEKEGKYHLEWQNDAVRLRPTAARDIRHMMPSRAGQTAASRLPGLDLSLLDPAKLDLSLLLIYISFNVSCGD